jgi:hypothetical protein
MSATVTELTARVRHWCLDCGQAIEPGELYKRVQVPAGDTITGRRAKYSRHAADDCTPTPGRKPRPKSSGYRWADVQPCGTVAAYRRHYRHGEKPCWSCRQARSRWAADYRERRGAA